MDDDEAKEKNTAGASTFMESSRLFKLQGQKTNVTDCGLWKLGSDWWCNGGKTRVMFCKCPLACWFECKCQVKITENQNYQSLETHGEHNEDCHNPSKDKSKYLKLKQLDAIQTGVRVSQQQSARELWCNLVNMSPEKRISWSLMQSLQCRVITSWMPLPLMILLDLWFAMQKQSGSQLYLRSIWMVLTFILACTMFLFLASALTLSIWMILTFILACTMFLLLASALTL